MGSSAGLQQQQLQQPAKPNRFLALYNVTFDRPAHCPGSRREGYPKDGGAPSDNAFLDLHTLCADIVDVENLPNLARA
eukprot:8599391-Prorocentrum_lima.AAC.1